MGIAAVIIFCAQIHPAGRRLVIHTWLLLRNRKQRLWVAYGLVITAFVAPKDAVNERQSTSPVLSLLTLPGRFSCRRHGRITGVGRPCFRLACVGRGQ